jgi:hypothetical protein
LTCSEYDSRYDNIELVLDNKDGIIEPILEFGLNSSGFTCNCVLEKGKTYLFSLKYLSNKVKSYNLTVEQDNWVYAPNGGIFYNPKHTSTFLGRNITDYMNYTKVYFSDDMLASMIAKWTNISIIDNRGTDKYAYQKELIHNIPRCFYSDEKVMGLDSLSSADIASFTSTAATYIGAGLLLCPEATVIAAFVTTVGAASTTQVIFLDMFDEYTQFETSLKSAVLSKDFDYRLSLRTYQAKSSEPCSLLSMSPYFVQWDSWNVKQNYINKYDEDIPELRGEVTPFTSNSVNVFDMNS